MSPAQRTKALGAVAALEAVVDRLAMLGHSEPELTPGEALKLGRLAGEITLLSERLEAWVDE